MGCCVGCRWFQLSRVAVRLSGASICLWLVCCLGPAEARATSLTAPEVNMTFHQGRSRDATLTCTVRDIGKDKVIWRRLSDPIPIAVGTTTFWRGSKYRVRQAGDHWSLVITNVRVADAGEYECRLSGSGDQAEILSLIIPGSGHPYFSTTRTTIESKLGDTVTLPCRVENIGKYLVLWQDADRKVLSLRKKVYSGDSRMRVVHDSLEEWSLRISNVRREDLGVYTCVVNTSPFITRTLRLVDASDTTNIETGGEKTPATTTPEVTTPFDPVEDVAPRLFAASDVVYQRKGRDAELQCRAVAVPRPEVHWLYNSQRLISDWKHQVTTEDQLHHTTVTTLRVRSLGVGNFGTYQCYAINRHGSGTISIRLAESVNIL